MSENKKEENKEQEKPDKNKDYIDKSVKQLLIQHKSASTSKSSLSAYCQGKGFSYLAGQTQSETVVVKPQFARKRFLRILDTCGQVLSEKYAQITNFKQQFSQDYAYDFQRKVIPHVVTKNKQIKILCLEFIKKPQACYMSYIVMSYSFQLAPNIIKQTIQKTCSDSSGFKAKVGPVSMGFSSQSSSSYSEEKLIEKDRGMTPEDLAMLVQLANVNNKRRQMMLEMFSQDKFNLEINY